MIRLDDYKRTEPGIYKHKTKTNTYFVVVRYDNSKFKDSDHVKGTLTDARQRKLEMLAALKQRARQGSLISTKKYTSVSAALFYYLRSHYRHTEQWKTGSGRRIIRKLYERFGAFLPEDVRNTDINAFIHELKGQGYKDAGILPFVSRFKTAMLHSRRVGRVRLHEDLFVDLIKLKADPPPKLVIRDEDTDIISAELPLWAQTYVLYKRLVPCRVIELYEALTVDINLSARSFMVRETKNSQEREMPIPAAMMDYFVARKNSSSTWIFPREKKTDTGEIKYYKIERNYLTKLFSKIRDEKKMSKAIILRRLRATTVSKWMRRFDHGTVGAVAGATAETLRTYYDAIEIADKVHAADKFALDNGHLMDTQGKILKFSEEEKAVNA